MQFSRDKVQLCSIQGRLFELSATAGYDSARFIDSFMRSETAACLDRPYDRLQWAGEEYILEEFSETVEPLAGDDPWSSDVLFWIGYLYRLWHYLTGEGSAQISNTADAETMRRCYPGYHTLDPQESVERLREAAALRMS